MKVPVIKVNGRIVGTNSHDCLYIKNNAIHYLNVQCMGSSEEYPEEIKFDCEEPDEYSFSAYPEIEFLELEDFVKLMIEQCKQNTERELKLREVLGKPLAEYKKTKNECAEKLKGSYSTSGILI